MLDTLRKYASSWVAQLLMGILVLSFGVWGVADVFTGFRSNDIARIGSTEITLNDFERDYNATMRQVSAQIGQDLTGGVHRHRLDGGGPDVDAYGHRT